MYVKELTKLTFRMIPKAKSEQFISIWLYQCDIYEVQRLFFHERFLKLRIPNLPIKKY